MHFHNENDLFVEAKGTDGTVHVFGVHSGLLAASSSVFHDMVYSRYSSHTRGNKAVWIWELQDHPIGLRAMFSILHHEVHAAMFLYSPQPDQLYHVLSVLDKYEINDRAFHPFARNWAEALHKSTSKGVPKDHQLLYIAYKLGDLEIFKKNLRSVAQQVEVVDGVLRLMDGQKLKHVIPVNGGVLHTIEAIRIGELERLLAVLREAYEFLIDESKTKEPKYCKSVDHHVDCHQKLLGSLLSNLVTMNLYPFSLASRLKSSVRKLADDMKAMEIRGL